MSLDAGSMVRAGGEAGLHMLFLDGAYTFCDSRTCFHRARRPGSGIASSCLPR